MGSVSGLNPCLCEVILLRHHQGANVKVNELPAGSVIGEIAVPLQMILLWH